MVQRHGKGLRRELGLLQMRQKFFRIHIDRMAADRLDDRHSTGFEHGPQGPHLADPAWTLHEAARLQTRAIDWPLPYLSGRDQLYREIARQQALQHAGEEEPTK